MLPRAWALKVVDLNVARLREDDLRRADVVMLSAMLVHEASVREVVARCAALGKRVVAGGPLFTTGHEAFPEIQHFVLGEAEELMPQLVADLESGRLQTIYQAANRPRMALSPVPRWELVDLKQYVTMAVQFSRGCPFDCEFCDIIVMNGRVPRTKSTAQGHRRVGNPANAGLAGHGVHRGRQFHREQNADPGVTARNDRLAAAHATKDGLLHRGLGESGG